MFSQRIVEGRFKSVVLMVITIDFILSVNLKRCLLEITVLISTIEILCRLTVVTLYENPKTKKLLDH